MFSHHALPLPTRVMLQTLLNSFTFCCAGALMKLIWVFLVSYISININLRESILLFDLQEGTSQARYLQARLIPAHKDPPYEQVNEVLWQVKNCPHVLTIFS